jgi:hypothetical protein
MLSQKDNECLFNYFFLSVIQAVNILRVPQIQIDYRKKTAEGLTGNWLELVFIGPSFTPKK